MKRSTGDRETKAFEEALLHGSPTKHYRLRLFVAGTSPRSTRAIQNIRALCEEKLHGRYDLEVIDIYQHPEHARPEQIVVTPTLVRKLPLPLRKIIGDLSDKERVLVGWISFPTTPRPRAPRAIMTPEGDNRLADYIRDLQERLAEAEETLRALRSGEVDAVVASGPDGDRVYTLKGADEAYRVMVQNMADGALTATHEGLILFANQQFASMLGMPLERVIGSSIHDFLVAEDAAMLDAVLTGPTGRTAEVRFRKASDAAVPVQLSATPLVLDDGECICVNVTELTEHKRNQEIVAAERLARSILDQAAGAIVVYSQVCPAQPAALWLHGAGGRERPSSARDPRLRPRPARHRAPGFRNAGDGRG
jgi:PAS domain S-box-containing protein